MALVSDGFDYPVGQRDASGRVSATQVRGDGDGFHNAQDFGAENTAAPEPFHLGEDWNGDGGADTDIGTAIHSVSNGTVRFAGNGGSGWGNVIIIDHALPSDEHGGTVTSLYAHLDSIDPAVRAGADVTRGQVIGELGRTGLSPSEGAHLHFELRSDESLAIGQGYSATARPSGWLDPSDFIDSHRTLAPSGGTNSPPQVVVSDVTVDAGHWVGLGGLINASDADPGETATSFALFDRGGDQTGYFWTPDEGRLPAGQSNVITAAELADVRIFAGAEAGAENLWVAAHDGEDWGEWARFTLTTGSGGDAAPLAVSDVALDAGHWVGLAGLITIADPDPGDAPGSFALFDRGGDQTGFFWTPDEGRLPAGQSNVITRAELADVRIFAGAEAGSENLWVAAHDGEAWSEWARFTLTTTSGSSTLEVAGAGGNQGGAALAMGDVLGSGAQETASAPVASRGTGTTGASAGELLQNLVVDPTGSEVA